MPMIRHTPSSATLTGGDLSVDVLHTEDSVQIGDGTNLLGTFSLVGGVRSLPVDVKQATVAALTDGTQKTKISDGVDAGVVEIDDVGGEKALKVSVIASVGGGGGGTAATDSAAFTVGATQFTPIGGHLDDTASDALAEGEMGAVRMTSARALHVAVQNSVAVTGTFWQATQPVSGTVSVTGVATEAKQDTMITSLQLIDDAVATTAAAIPTKGLAVSGTDGTNARILKTDASGELQVDVLTMPTVTVTGTVAATQSGTWNIGSITTLPALAAGTNNIGDVDVLTLPSIPAGTNNIGDVDIASIAAGDNNIGNVDIVTMPAITGTVTANAGTGTFTVGGVAAHDAAVSGNPVLVAGRGTNANPTSVASGDVVYMNMDLAGRVITSSSDRSLVVQATGSQATTTEATMLAAGAAGVFHDITMLVFTNSNTTTAAQVQLRDATAGTIRFEHVIPANSGMVITFPTPLVQTTAANNWTIDLNAAVSTVFYTVQAIKRVA